MFYCSVEGWVLARISLLLFGWFFSACAYQWGPGERVMPGGYKSVFIPIFKNYSMEPGIEVDYTNALRREFERSKVAQVSDPGVSEVELDGEILSIGYAPGSILTGQPFPTGTVLAGSYEIRVSLKLTLKRRSDGKDLWHDVFNGSRSYTTPQVSMATINSVDPLYNLSARRQNLQIMAQTMMAEAHDRLSENF